MKFQADEEQCRAELAVVLASSGFKRSPKLSRLLAYLCDKQLTGKAGDINEYSIAIEALGRNASFNPQQDAVVRVDLYHLRKRLKEYYGTEGAEHSLRIQIPNGQYTPEFTVADDVAVEAEPALVPIELPPPATPPPASGHRKRWLPLLALIFAIVAPVILYRSARISSKTPPVSGVAGSGEIRIAAGERGGPYIDSAGRAWEADRYFTGGSAFHHAVPILRTRDQDLFQNGREGQFVYAVPLHPGIYEVHLYFAETGVATDTLRSVNVAINAQPFQAIDIASDAGGINTATMKVFRDVSPGKDGFVRIMMQGADGKSFLNALEIVPGTPGKMNPIRMITGDTAFRDHAGQVWLPEQWASGGRKSTRAVSIQGTPDPPLYQWERVGHFNYSIPVAEGGVYTVVLHFSETWFTPANSPGGIGSRVFHVYCNGATLLTDFDILKEAGGVPDRAVIKTFKHIPASPQGKIELQFIPVANYALLNAIEIFPE